MSRVNLIFLAVCTAVWLILHQWISLQNQDLIFEDLQSEGATVSEIRPAGRSAQTLPESTPHPWALRQQIRHDANGR